jgi:hypothetical protein
MGRYLAGAMPHVRARYVPEGGHFMALDLLDEIVAALGI